MLHPVPGIFGCREREITTAKILACRTRRNAGPGRRALLLTVLTVTLLTPQALTAPILTVLTHQAHIVPILTVLILLILPAPTKWSPCLARAAISCTTILPTPPFTATAK